MSAGELSIVSLPSFHASPHLLARKTSLRRAPSVAPTNFSFSPHLVAGRRIEMGHAAIDGRQQRGRSLRVVALAVPADETHAAETRARRRAHPCCREDVFASRNFPKSKRLRIDRVANNIGPPRRLSCRPTLSLQKKLSGGFVTNLRMSRATFAAVFAVSVALVLSACSRETPPNVPGPSRRVTRRSRSLKARADRVQDSNDIKRLQRAYGYYVDKAEWDQVADLFALDGSVEYANEGVYTGQARIRDYLKRLGGWSQRSGRGPAQ